MKSVFSILSAAIIISILSFFACTREYVEDINGVCFEQDVLPIFVANCTQSDCHNAKDKKEGYDLTNYAGIVKKGIKPGNFADSKMYEVLIKSSDDDIMPPKPYNRLTDSQISTIALWIDEGAKNTTCTSTTCDTTAVTYSGTVLPLMTKYCNGCHGGAAPSAGIDLTTHSKTLPSVKDGSFLGSIKFESGFSAMPKNGNKLSNCNIKKIQAWINAGAPNN